VQLSRREGLIPKLGFGPGSMEKELARGVKQIVGLLVGY